MKTCSIADCPRKFYAKNLCKPHYNQGLSTTAKQCGSEGCMRGAVTHGLCKSHYSKSTRNTKTSQCAACSTTFTTPATFIGRPPSTCSDMCRSFVEHGHWPTCAVTIGYQLPQCELPSSHPARQHQPPPRTFVAGQCAECGDYFTVESWTGEARYCSTTCTRRFSSRLTRAARRARKNSTSIDRGLTWQAVAARDGSDCYLCNQPTDTADYSIHATGTICVGPMYPSLDHVVPLARGGSHTFGNAKLAHMHCNSLKSDALLAV